MQVASYKRNEKKKYLNWAKRDSEREKFANEITFGLQTLNSFWLLLLLLFSDYIKSIWFYVHIWILVL